MRCSAIVRRASSARQRPRMWVRLASRRYHGSLVVMPMWANWVDASIAGPACPAGAHAPPVSATATASSWRSRNTAPLGSAGRPRGEHDRDRPVGIVGQHRRGALAVHDRPALGRERGDLARLGQDGARLGQGHQRLLLRRRQPRVDPGGDGAELGRGRVGDDVAAVGRDAQHHPVAVADAPTGEHGRDRVRALVELVGTTRSTRRGRRRRSGPRTGGRPRGPWRRAPRGCCQPRRDSSMCSMRAALVRMTLSTMRWGTPAISSSATFFVWGQVESVCG